ncbi:MAG: chromate transporter [Eubacteriales bacterium]|nr:chromate transporter [Eubacteriales bacterium]
MPGKLSDNHTKVKRPKLLTLFFTMLYISSFTFGGGFVIITFMKRKFVDELGWLTEAEMLDYTALAQSSPGAIAVNAAILVGWKTAGFPGMLAAVAGTVLPPLIILSLISLFYAAFSQNPVVALILKGMQAGVAAVILSVSLDLGKNVAAKKSIFALAILLAAFLMDHILQLNVIWIILLAAAAGLFRYLLAERRRKQTETEAKHPL